MGSQRQRGFRRRGRLGEGPLVGVALAFVLVSTSCGSEEEASSRSRRGVVDRRPVIPSSPPADDAPETGPDPFARRRPERRPSATGPRTGEAKAPSPGGAEARQPEITLYSTSWCGYCQRARAYLRAAGIRYRERDIDEDPAARAACAEINPRVSVPTFEVGDRVVIGFSPERLSSAIAAESR